MGSVYIYSIYTGQGRFAHNKLNGILHQVILDILQENPMGKQKGVVSFWIEEPGEASYGKRCHGNIGFPHVEKEKGEPFSDQDEPTELLEYSEYRVDLGI